MKFNETYYEKYGIVGGKETPCFLMGTSLGGMVNANIATLNHMNYAGIIHAVPYFGLTKELQNTIDKIRPVVQAMVKVTPNQMIPIKDFKKSKKHI